MNYAELITVVVPTYNRYDRLTRLLRYYESYGFPYPIRILDSSVDKTKSHELEEILRLSCIQYEAYSSDTFLTDKIYLGLTNVSTPYVVLNADDDYLVPEAVKLCVDFLTGSPDYSLCEGRHINFKVAGEEDIVFGSLYKQMRSVEFDTPSERVKWFLPNYYPIFYGVYKTEVLRKNFKLTKEHTDDLRFFEILPAMITATKGKIKILDILFIALEEGAYSTGATTDTMLDFKRKKTFDEKYRRFKACLADELARNEDISIQRAEKVVDEAMYKYLTLRMPSFYFTFRRIRLFLWNRVPVIRYVVNLFNRPHKEQEHQVFLYNDSSNEWYASLERIRRFVGSMNATQTT